MSEIKLIFVSTVAEPDKNFLVCDLTDGGDFVDPLGLFAHPLYDMDNVNLEGLYAIGGEINSKLLEKSYKWGIFPWFPYKESPDAYWYCPQKRYVLFPGKIHVSHSLRTQINKNKYHLTINKSFKEVIHNCRTVNGRDCDELAWLGEDIEKGFLELHDKEYAKSVELWEGDKLIGGFYGFWFKGIFQGESMFSFRPSASQIALIMLCRIGEIDGVKIKFIDTQFETPTFKRLGGEYITYSLYRELMKN